MKTTKQEEPAIASVCGVVGLLTAIGGAGLFVFALANLNSPGAQSGAAVGIALVLSSVGWFLAARVVTLLTQIERNTRKPTVPVKSPAP